MPTGIPFDMEPMLAGAHPDLPVGDAWMYEPKWDGFRTLVHRAGDSVELVSRGARMMTRYFPEILPAFKALHSDPVVLDGELVTWGRTASTSKRCNCGSTRPNHGCGCWPRACPCPTSPSISWRLGLRICGSCP